MDQTTDPPPMPVYLKEGWLSQREEEEGEGWGRIWKRTGRSGSGGGQGWGRRGGTREGVGKGKTVAVKGEWREAVLGSPYSQWQSPHETQGPPEMSQSCSNATRCSPEARPQHQDLAGQHPGLILGPELRFLLEAGQGVADPGSRH